MDKVTLISKWTATVHVEERAPFNLFHDCLIIAAGELSALIVATFFTTFIFSLLRTGGSTRSLIHDSQIILVELWISDRYKNEYKKIGDKERGLNEKLSTLIKFTLRL